ncbi:DUF4349 domain-containing protein [Nakamurella sp. GG22]
MSASLVRRTSRCIVAVLAGGVLLAGCTAGTGTASSENAAQVTVAAAAEAPAGRDAAEFGVGSADAAGQLSAPDGAPAPAADAPQEAADLPAMAAADGKVIRTADLAVRLEVGPVPTTGNGTADRDAAAAARAAAASEAAGSARQIATAAGGFQASAEGGGSQFTISLRVPTAQYDSVLGKLSGLGEVTRRTESSEDVTGRSADVDSRVKSMTASVARVRALLSEATSIGDVISIEAELAAREADLESLQQQKAALDGQVALSTIGLSLTAVSADDAPPPATADSGFVAGIKAGWSSLLEFLSWSGGVVGALLPFLPIVVAVGALLWWCSRRLARRRSAARRMIRDRETGVEAPDTAPTAEPEPVGAGQR